MCKFDHETLHCIRNCTMENIVTTAVQVTNFLAAKFPVHPADGLAAGSTQGGYCASTDL
jgi:hypothetical protein